MPALITRLNGDKEWRMPDGSFHREDGPALEYADGSKFWFINGQIHRKDGPAIIWAGGNKEWYRNGLLHREDGPAVEYAYGGKSWCLNGALLSEEEWRQQTRKKFIFRRLKCLVK
jgi:hypothetical protein